MNENYKISKRNSNFIDSAVLNDGTFIDYLYRFMKIATSIFEWVNLPKSMNARKIEQDLFLYGQCALLKDKDYGYINTRCASNGYLNIYGLPTSLNCYSYKYQKVRKLYTGLPRGVDDEDTTSLIETTRDNECILVMNNYDRLPTNSTMELFAYRLYMASRTSDINIQAQRTPVMVIVDEKQRQMMMNLYNQYNGNQPFIFGDKSQLQEGLLKSIKTDAPFIADKIENYKKEIWNEALTFLGVNNIQVEKAERLVTGEVSANNELINLNLQSYLITRQQACDEFNELFGLTGNNKISVRVRSDLHNLIKEYNSIANDFPNDEIEEIEGVINE